MQLRAIPKVIFFTLLTGVLTCFTMPSAKAQENPAAIRHEAAIYYKVKQGDTLWDISERFADSPWLWPDVWRENNQILNPHLIYPGQRIRLFHSQAVEKITPKVAESESKIPVATAPEAPFFLFSAIDQVGFIRKKPFQPSGHIFSGRDQKTMISHGDTIYVKPYVTDMQPAKRFTVYRTRKPTTPESGSSQIGTQYYLVGIIAIKSIKSQYALATVVRSFRTIRINDLLMPYTPRSPKITLKESPAGLTANIIATEEHQRIFADHAIAFIDKGLQDHVKPGQTYSIYYQEKKQLDSKTGEMILLDPVDYGALMVLIAEATTSTVVITSAQKSIQPGAKIRTPLK